MKFVRLVSWRKNFQPIPSILSESAGAVISIAQWTRLNVAMVQIARSTPWSYLEMTGLSLTMRRINHHMRQTCFQASHKLIITDSMYATCLMANTYLMDTAYKYPVVGICK